MGVNIIGYIEVCRHQRQYRSDWRAVVDVSALRRGDDKNYPIYDCLFGPVYSAAVGVASHRGLPQDVSKELTLLWALDRPDAVTGFEDASGTWISWAEIIALDPANVVEELAAILQGIRDDGTPFPLADSRQSAPPITIWQRVLGIMWVLAELYGDEGVRLIACFA